MTQGRNSHRRKDTLAPLTQYSDMIWRRVPLAVPFRWAWLKGRNSFSLSNSLSLPCSLFLFFSLFISFLIFFLSLFFFKSVFSSFSFLFSFPFFICLFLFIFIFPFLDVFLLLPFLLPFPFLYLAFSPSPFFILPVSLPFFHSLSVLSLLSHVPYLSLKLIFISSQFLSSSVPYLRYSVFSISSSQFVIFYFLVVSPLLPLSLIIPGIFKNHYYFIIKIVHALINYDMMLINIKANAMVVLMFIQL